MNTQPYFTDSRAVPYRDALRWLMLNDDCSDVFDLEAPPLISWHLVADIYGRTTDDVLGDLRRLIAIERPADVPPDFWDDLKTQVTK